MLRLQTAQLPATALAIKPRLRFELFASAEVRFSAQQQSCFAGME